MSRGAAFALLALTSGLSGCALPKDYMQTPELSAVGTGIADASPESRIELPPTAQSAAPPRPVNLYADQRIAHVGDILTVNISINDKATFGNSSDRSTTSKGAFNFDWLWTPMSTGAGGGQASPMIYKHDFSSTSSSQGTGDINRSEQIQLSVPAIVTAVLPNGNLVIKGSQEVRVNFELRQLTIAGIVRPSDIARDNTVAYDRIAEARISYGGRGRQSEVQQPSWGQQLYDIAKPY
jgi:flagellar L-ring protein FlgH